MLTNNNLCSPHPSTKGLHDTKSGYFPTINLVDE